MAVRNCTLAAGGGDGLDLRTTAMTPLLENVTIQGHAGVAVRQTLVDMSPTYNNLTFTGNGTNAVVVPGGNIAHAIVFDGSAARLNGSPYIITGDLVVNSGKTLTVTPGTTIRWDGAPRLNVQNGAALIAEGTAAAPITITTNAATPAAGAWQYIQFEGGSQGRLSHCTIEYAGASNHPAIYVDSSDVRLLVCTFRNNQAD